MQIILSAVLHKDNLTLISILLWLYFHLGFTKLAHPELLATIGHLGTARAGTADPRPRNSGLFVIQRARE